MSGSFTAETSARISERNQEPAWLAESRARALKLFESLPWPDQSVEEWRHTDIRGLDIDRFSLQEMDAPKIDADLEDVLGSCGASEFEAKFVALNAAFSTPGVVHAQRGVALDAPVLIDHTVGSGLAVMPRTVVVAEEGSSLTVIERFAAEQFDGDALCVSAVEIYARDGANVDYLAIQDWPQTVWHFGIQRAVVGRDATVRTLMATLGARFSRAVTQSVLDGKGAHTEMLGMYFGDHEQHIDNRTLQLHQGENTSSNLYYKGALKGNSRAIYSGLVDIEKSARGADAQQANRNLILSQGASALPDPFLEIKTSEVVRATHGVSVGKPDENVLFYLQSRGLDEAAAQRVFVTGFFQEIIDRVHVAQIREALEAAVEYELALED